MFLSLLFKFNKISPIQKAPAPVMNSDIDRHLNDAYQVLVTLSKLSIRSVPMPEG